MEKYSNISKIALTMSLDQYKKAVLDELKVAGGEKSLLEDQTYYDQVIEGFAEGRLPSEVAGSIMRMEE